MRRAIEQVAHEYIQKELESAGPEIQNEEQWLQLESILIDYENELRSGADPTTTIENATLRFLDAGVTQEELDAIARLMVKYGFTEDTEFTQ